MSSAQDICQTHEPKPAVPARRQYHHGNLRLALIQASLELLPQAGLRDLSLRAVARHVGVSAPAAYNFFASRDALLAAVASQGFRMLSQICDQAVQEAKDQAAKEQAFASAYVSFAKANGVLYRLMYSNEQAALETFGELKEEANSFWRKLTKLFSQNPSSNSIPVPDPGMVSAWSSMHGLAMLLVDGQISVQNMGYQSLDTMVDEVVMHSRAQPNYQVSSRA